MKGSRIEVPRKTIGDQVREGVLAAIIGSIIFHLITGFLKILFWPTKYLFMSDAELRDMDVQKALKKKDARASYLESLRNDPNDPMNQYTERFLTGTFHYQNDPENDTYLAWYKAWKDGEILDSRLRWAPEVYTKVNGRNTVSTDFLNYFEYQVDAHRAGPWANKALFMSTVRKYFPEFTPKWGRIQVDIDALRDRTEERHERENLFEELRKMGLPEDMASEMSNKGKLDIEKARNLKDCIDNGLSGRAAQYAVENGIDQASDKARTVHTLLEKGCPIQVVDARVRGDLDDSEFEDVIEYVTKLINEHGLNLYTEGSREGSVLFDECVEDKLKEVLLRKRGRVFDKATGRAAWDR